MSIIDDLKEVLESAEEHQEFPTWLSDEINKIIAEPDKFSNKIEEIDNLIGTIEQYDPFAESGCFKEGTDHNDVQRVLKKIFG